MSDSPIRKLLFELEDVFAPGANHVSYTLDRLMMHHRELLKHPTADVRREVLLMVTEGLVTFHGEDSEFGGWLRATETGRIVREASIQVDGYRASCLARQEQFEIDDLIIALAAAPQVCKHDAHHTYLTERHLGIYLHKHGDRLLEGIDRLCGKNLLRQVRDPLSREKEILITADGLRHFESSVRNVLGLLANECVLENPRRVVDFRRLVEALWVLESVDDDRPADSMSQGTAFGLAGTGFVTCAHVLKGEMVAFQPSSASRRYPVTVVAQDRHVDLALVSFDAPGSPVFLPRCRDAIPARMSEVVLAGFPNYAPGKEAYIVEGHVTSTFTRSAITRFTISAPIVFGNSGGPVLNTAGEVVGIGYLGTATFQASENTDGHAVLPVELVDGLRDKSR